MTWRETVCSSETSFARYSSTPKRILSSASSWDAIWSRSCSSRRIWASRSALSWLKSSVRRSSALRSASVLLFSPWSTSVRRRMCSSSSARTCRMASSLPSTYSRSDSSFRLNPSSPAIAFAWTPMRKSTSSSSACTLLRTASASASSLPLSASRSSTVAIMASIWALISARMSRRRRSVISISWWASWLASTFLRSTDSSPSSSCRRLAHSWIAACSASILRETPSISAFMPASLLARSSSSARFWVVSAAMFLDSASILALSSARSWRSFCWSSSSSARPTVSTSSRSCTTWSSASMRLRYLLMCESIRSEVAAFPPTSSISFLNTSVTSRTSCSSRDLSASSSCLLRFAAASDAFRSAFFVCSWSRYLSRCWRMSAAATMEPLTNSSCSCIFPACCCSFCITLLSAPIWTRTLLSSPSSLPVASFRTTWSLFLWPSSSSLAARSAAHLCATASSSPCSFL
mmetsp:Transcript_38885/g.92001  ORF Transcript_38885/g.92001 Transcript_38885/m.92001 type:complete len:463 (+) Transcript_38885:705-2093(+)